ncbi:suppressor of fused domain protein [Myxococcota bacterium]|nr:suppressor of fused domain protein [Myxococcota bacterium]
MDVKAVVEAHLVHHLGAPSARFSTFTDGRPMRFEVLRFRDRPVRGATLHATLGLCEHPFALQHGAVREELVFSAWQRFDDWDVPAMLHTIASMIATRETAVLRGQVLDPGRPLFPGSTLSALYFTAPPYVPEAFDYLATTVPPTLFVGLVPISTREAQVITEQGWSRFEDSLVARNPDLLDLTRQSLTAL